MSGLSDLIKALEILKKYDDPDFPTHCEHDTLSVCVAPAKVSKEDLAALDELGFIPNEEDEDTFVSFRFGSA